MAVPIRENNQPMLTAPPAPGAAISATPTSPKASPASRPAENLSSPKASAIGKARNGTVEIRIDMIPAGRCTTAA